MVSRNSDGIRTLRRMIPWAPPSVLFLFGLLGCLFFAAGTYAPSVSGHETSPPIRITNVKISTPQFNPQKEEKVAIEFSLWREASVTLKIFDPDFELVAILVENQNNKPGAHKVSWGGKDAQGAVVPDEAYFFTIEARDKEGHTDVYDPITFSGGELYDLAQADFAKETNKVTYKLGHAGRVLLQMGIQRGPLMKTLVDWKPRPAGVNAESWDGRDDSKGVDLRNDPFFVGTIKYFTLPENAIIASGNETVTYEAYKTRWKGTRPIKVARARRLVSNQPISPHFLKPKTQYRMPKIQVSFPEVAQVTDAGLPLVEGRTLILVDIDPQDKELYKDQASEIYFFLDKQFLIEDGKPQMPYTFRYSFSSVREGEHLLTVNFLAGDNQIGTASQKIMVKATPNRERIH